MGLKVRIALMGCLVAAAAFTGSTPALTRAGPKKVKMEFWAVVWEPVSIPMITKFKLLVSLL